MQKDTQEPNNSEAVFKLASEMYSGYYRAVCMWETSLAIGTVKSFMKSIKTILA